MVDEHCELTHSVFYFLSINSIIIENVDFMSNGSTLKIYFDFISNHVYRQDYLFQRTVID